MTKKAEAFQKYLADNNIDAFAVEDVKHSENNITVFRSHITVEGQNFPLVVIFDSSIFTVIRVQILTRAMNDANRLPLLAWVNDETAKYKLFRFYFNNDGSLMLELCHTADDPEADISGDTLYLFFDMIINYLDESYRRIMKVVFR